MRLLVVVGLVILAAATAWLIGRFRRPPHPTITVGDVGDRPGVVLFTATTCGTCREAIARLESLGIPFREVTDELEHDRFDRWGVVAVPVTVVVSEGSEVVAAFSGVPPRRQLQRSVVRAGITLG